MALCLVLLGVLAWPFLRALGALFASEGNYSHGFIIPFVSAYAAWQILEDHADAGVSGRWRWAGPVVALGGLLLTVFSYWYAEGMNPGGTGWLFLGSLGLLAVLAGMVLAAWGLPWLRRLSFPLGFLCFALPLPASLLARITLRLQMLGSLATAVLLRFSGIAVTRDGNVLHTPGGPVGIIDACSGIRSLWVLLAVAAAVLHFGRYTWRRGLVLLGTVPLLAVAGNLVRLYVSALLIAHGHTDFASGSAHELLGLLTFLLALGGLFAANRWLAPPIRSGTTPAVEPTQPTAGDTAAPALLPLLAVLAVIALGMGFRLAVGHHYAVTDSAEFLAGAERKTFAEFPRKLGDFTLVDITHFSPEELAELRPSDHMIGRYTNSRGQTVEAQLSYWHPQKLTSMEAFRHPHWPDTCYPSQGWTHMPELDTARTYDWLPGEEPRTRGFRKALDGDQTAVVILVAWRSRADPRRLFVPSAWGKRLRALVDSWRRKKRLVRSQYGITLRVFLGPTIPEPDDALRVIDEFGQALGPQLPAFGLSREQIERDRAASATHPGDSAP
jgi:exosortase